MKTFYLASATEQSLLLIFLFLTLLFSLFLMIIIFSREGNKIKTCGHLVILLLQFWILYLLTDAFAYTNGAVEYKRMLPVPIGMFWMIVFFFQFILFWDGFHLYRTRDYKLDQNSIKQAMDLLPEGICYFTSDGMVKLCNLQMYHLFYILTGKDLQKQSELENALELCDEKTRILRLSDQRQTYLFPDGKAWRYQKNNVTDKEGNAYTEVIFSDITKLYHKNLELKKQTERLKEISRKLKRLSDNVLILTKEKEVLAAKTKLHDQMGAGLTAVRRILQNYEAAEIENAINPLRQAVSAVKNDNEYPQEQGDFAKLMQDAEAIGVKMNLCGNLPKYEAYAHVFILAMRECLTNALRYADATELFIKMKKEGNVYSIIISNNGAPPEKKVVPKGGLYNLYHYVLECGGEMQIQSQPIFALMITIPEEGGKN